jgi:hypothetical protein
LLLGIEAFRRRTRSEEMNMTEKKTDNMILAEAAARDFYDDTVRNLASMSQGQYEVTMKAVDDFKTKVAEAENAANFDRKITKMSDRELTEYIRDCDDAARKNKAG